MNIKPSHDRLELCERASVMLRGVGFILHNVASKTESCYYRWPDRSVLLRVSGHRRARPLLGFPKIISKITFTGNCHDMPGEMRLADGKLQQIVAQAIGMYFLHSKSGD